MKNAENICLNCDHQLQNELYCPICGQKTSVHNLSLRYLLSRFYIAFLDFDKKLLSSLRDIWVPNKISNSFLKGSRDVYVNHLRFFFLSLALLFFLIALNMRDLDMTDTDLVRQSEREKVLSELISYEQEHDWVCDTMQLEALKQQLFGIDTSEEVSDTLLQGVLIFDGQSNILTDLYKLEPDSLLNKNEVEGEFNRFAAKQFIKVVKNGGSSVSFIVGNLFWGLILLTIIMALVLKLLYVRHRSFFAEHLMQMINAHCVLSLSFSVLLIMTLFGDPPSGLVLVAILFSFLYLMISLLLYYRQGWIKTILKGFIIMFTYIVAMTIVLILVALLSVLFF